jgi:fumarate reductase subunit C
MVTVGVDLSQVTQDAAEKNPSLLFNKVPNKADKFCRALIPLSVPALAAYAIFLAVLVARAGDAAAFGRTVEAMQSTWSVALHLVVLAMALFHTITWIGLVPKVLVLWRGEDRVSPALIAGAHYAAWAVLSGIVAWVVLR